ncbi:tetratricopeptide repeat protein [Rhizorhabdus argentea]|uniref:tetratricopeptide repeat protein n=1 Tax=Rhizorhabdus argentea TaxID=1387174 RepID=UPI0030EB92A6
MARIWAGALLLPLVLTGCGQSQEKAAKAAARFDAYYAARNYFAARIEISRAIAAQEDVPEYWSKLARVQTALGRYLDAYSAYSHVIELDRKDDEAVQALAELSYSGGSFDNAEKFADQWLALQPRSLRMLLVKGSVAAARHDLAGARAIVDRMLAIDPANEGATILLARVLNSGGDPEAAIGTIETSIARDGETVPKLVVLLDLYAGQDDFRRSARTYARLFSLRPADVELRLDYVKLLYERGMSDRALAMLSRLTRSHPGDAALQQRIVDVWDEVGSAAVDVDRVRRFVTADGGDQMKVALGHLLLDQKRYADAEAVLRPFIDADGITAANVEADVLYAGALAGLGRGERATALIDRILDFDEGNPRALLMRARVLVARGDLPDALRYAQLLVRDNPGIAEGRIALARIYVRRKEPILADNAYAQAMNELPDDSTMLAAYLRYLLDTGRASGARDVAKRFTDDNPRSRDGWRERARLCIGLGDAECVEQAFAALDRISGGAKIRHALAPAWTAQQRDARPLGNSPPAVAGR